MPARRFDFSTPLENHDHPVSGNGLHHFRAQALQERVHLAVVPGAHEEALSALHGPETGDERPADAARLQPGLDRALVEVVERAAELQGYAGRVELQRKLCRHPDIVAPGKRFHPAFKLGDEADRVRLLHLGEEVGPDGFVRPVLDQRFVAIRADPPRVRERERGLALRALVPLVPWRFSERLLVYVDDAVDGQVRGKRIELLNRHCLLLTRLTRKQKTGHPGKTQLLFQQKKLRFLGMSGMMMQFRENLFVAAFAFIQPSGDARHRGRTELGRLFDFLISLPGREHFRGFEALAELNQLFLSQKIAQKCPSLGFGL